MVKMRLAGMSFGAIATAAGISRQSVHDRLKVFSPERMDLGDFTRNEAHFYKLEEVGNLNLGAMLRDKATKDLIQYDHVNGRAIDCATRLFTSAAILFDKRRLIEGKSTVNSSHFGTFYLKAEKLKPDYDADDMTEQRTTHADDVVDVTPTSKPLMNARALATTHTDAKSTNHATPAMHEPCQLEGTPNAATFRPPPRGETRGVPVKVPRIPETAKRVIT